MHRAVVTCAFVTLAIVVGCGAGAAGRGDDTEFVVLAKRVGRSLHLDVVGFQHSDREGGPFENPDNWKLSVSAGGEALQPVVKGAVRVKRDPAAKGSGWQVSVEFSVAYAMPTASDRVDVRITAPGASPKTMRVAVQDGGAITASNH